MALPGTHLRLALDLAGHCPIGDVGRYLAGTIYPDSRWLTGVAREDTHGHGCLAPGFGVSDFTRGWQIHCQCDRIQSQIHEALLDNLAALDDAGRWIRLSAAKMIQDMSDAMHFDPGAVLPGLAHTEAPNGEDLRAVAAFNDTIRSIYAHAPRMSLEIYARLWSGIGLEPERIGLMMNEARSLVADPGMVDRIQSSYGDLLERCRSALPSPGGGDVKHA